ncbi:hypothetical protein EKH57_06085 [Halorubrum sp. BOL3-1]|uniref:hypothetical protein n=1 Tax=Halorubrum sp. BOL3-1 TaxID=2497325 RepID=UPI001004F52A|nr:hypothetical protein [Halorubrum sp. BOL3-1]QAU12320.1 hypothetical protein EKH57_06085 [Halorubrum sp. BOL3-1]
MNRGQSLLLLLIGAVALLTLFVILPFVEYVIASAVLAFVLYPFYRRLTRRLRARVSKRFGEMLSALTLIFSSIVP